MKIRWIVIAGLGLVTSGLASGQPAQPPASNEQIEQAIKQLGDDNFVVRQNATALLWSIGGPAEPFLRKALDSSDAEVVARARDLLDKISFGILPNSSPKYVALVARARHATAATWTTIVTELLSEGIDGYELAKTLADKQSDAARRAIFRRGIDKQGWRVANRYIATGNLERAEELLARSAACGTAPTGDLYQLQRHYSAFVRLVGSLEAKRQQWDKWAEGREGVEGFLDDVTPDGRAAKFVAAFLAKAASDNQRARTLADSIGQSQLMEITRFDAAAWKDLIDIAPPERVNQPLLIAGLKSTYARLGGESEKAEQLRKAFDQSISTITTNDYESFRAFRCLLFDGQIDHAMTWSKDVPAQVVRAARAEIMAQQGRVSEAIQLVNEPRPGREPLTAMDMAAVRLFTLIGDKKSVAELLNRMKRDRYDDASVHRIGADFVEQLVGLGHMEAATDQSAALIAGNYSMSEVFGKLHPKAPLAAETWCHYLMTIAPEDPMAKTLRQIPPLIDQRLAEPANKAKIEAAIVWAKDRPTAEQEKHLRGFAEAYHAAGQNEPALALLTQVAETNPAIAHLKRGDIFADMSKWREAAEAYEQSWKADNKQALPVWLASVAHSKIGNNDLANKHRLTARLLPLGDEAQRITFCEELNKRSGFLGDAIRPELIFQRKLVVDLSYPGSNSARDALSPLCTTAEAFPDRKALADANQQFLLRMLRTNAYFKNNNGYLNVLHRLQSARARHLLNQGDVAGAVQAAQEAHAILPTTYSLAVELVPELDTKNKTQEANDIYRATAEALDKLVTDFPKSATFAGNRAWLATRCRRDLDRALELAQRAVELSPDSTAHRETLSEVYLQKGDNAAAKTALQPALTKQPKNQYLQKLLQRIEAGDANAPLPER